MLAAPRSRCFVVGQEALERQQPSPAPQRTLPAKRLAAASAARVTLRAANHPPPVARRPSRSGDADRNKTPHPALKGSQG